MAKRNKEPTWKDFFEGITGLAGIIVGRILGGFLWGIGFWWAFYEFMK